MLETLLYVSINAAILLVALAIYLRWFTPEKRNAKRELRLRESAMRDEIGHILVGLPFFLRHAQLEESGHNRLMVVAVMYDVIVSEYEIIVDFSHEELPIHLLEHPGTPEAVDHRYSVGDLEQMYTDLTRNITDARLHHQFEAWTEK